MRSIAFKFHLDGKEINKTQAQTMFDNTNFTVKDGGVYFATTVTPVSKFSHADFRDQIEYRESLIELLNKNVKSTPVRESLKQEIIKEIDTLKLENKINSAEKEFKVDSNYSLKNRLEKPNYNSTRHKYNPARNVQNALQRAEEHQEKNGREENLESERFGNGIYWMLRPSTKEEKKVISDLESKSVQATRKTFDGKSYSTAKENVKIEPKQIRQYESLSSMNKEEGVKHSKGKLFYELDFGFIEQLAERMQSNKENSKYTLWNWKKPMKKENIENLKQALLRHVLAVMEDVYEDDGREFGHLEAISNNCMMINYQLKQNK